jgi:S-adenosylmethionine:tRNA ribosyltransferase-isomerase
MKQGSLFSDEIFLSDFGYDLPDERIARYPLEQRENSKLLCWKGGRISESQYSQLPFLLPSDSVLVFNNSRVIEARIIFQKPTGGEIEIFCLKPNDPYAGMQQSMGQTGHVLWMCLIGGASKWKHGQVLTKQIGEILLEARFIRKNSDDFTVQFSWAPSLLTFAELLQRVGTIPLPPYLNRNAEKSDGERYQTVYARKPGSVAAPTAGLHFTEKLLQDLSASGIRSIYLTLHVGAGTFMPVKAEKVSEHRMHEEFIELTAETLEALIMNLHKTIIAVGTTALRTLETLYWLGMLVSRNKNISPAELRLDQWFAYSFAPSMDAVESLHCLLSWIQMQPEKKIFTKTQLFIVPGYSFKIVKGLITNFHQPHSTLLMLVAALIGPSWKSVYQFALNNDYRFLSYGDGCFFLPVGVS